MKICLLLCERMTLQTHQFSFFRVEMWRCQKYSVFLEKNKEETELKKQNPEAALQPRIFIPINRYLSCRYCMLVQRERWAVHHIGTSRGSGLTLEANTSISRRRGGREGQVPKWRRRGGMKRVRGILSRWRSKSGCPVKQQKQQRRLLIAKRFLSAFLPWPSYLEFLPEKYLPLGEHQGNELLPFIPCPYSLFPKAGGKSS